MGCPREPEPAALLIGALYSAEEQLQQARQMLVEAAGPVARLEPEIDFNFTDYYREEMGDGLKRCFLRAERLVPRGELAQWKLMTNRIEQALCDPDGRRRVNLDAGLLSPENLVLASTKARDHRVYLADGIFAELTLRFTGGRFQPLAWTYPDWQSAGALQALGQARGWLLEKLAARRREAKT